MLIKVFFIITVLMITVSPQRAAAEQFRWIIKPVFESAESFSEGVAAVMTGGKYGYVNSRGIFVIKPEYDKADDFYRGKARVISNGVPSYINRKGVRITDVKEDVRRYFGEGVAVIRINGKYGYLTDGGRPVIAPLYEDALSFNEGVAAVKIDGKYGFINKKGKIVIRPVYENASIFSEGVAAVRINGAWGYINRKGVMVVKAVYAEAGDFRSGSAPVKGESGFGYINSRGGYIIDPQFESALPFSEKAAAVKVNGKWGFIKRASGGRNPLKKKLRAEDKVQIPEQVKEKLTDNIRVKKDDSLINNGRDEKTDKEKSRKEQAVFMDKKDSRSREIKGSGVNDYTSVEKIREGKTPLLEERIVNADIREADVTDKKTAADKNIPVIKGMEYVGILSEVNAGQVIVTDYKTGSKVFLGAWCITKVDEDRVYLEAGTPFSTVAKCDFKNGFYEKIKPGMKVYKKNK